MSLTHDELVSGGLTGWALLARCLATRFATADFAAGLAFVNEIGAAAQAADHHPDVTLSYSWVEVRLRSHDVDAVTDRDVALARSINELAAAAGLVGDVGAVAEYELGLDAAAAARIGPFWSALLTGSSGNWDGAENVIDPAGRVPLLWFQSTDEHQTPRQRFHIDLWLDPSVVQTRIDAAVAAGGAVVDDSNAPSFIVLADADGNRVCICTSEDRRPAQ